MTVTLQDYLDHLGNNNNRFHPIAKMELLDRDEHIMSNQVFDKRIISGTLNVQKNNGSRRTSTITLDNTDGAVTPSTDIFWVNQKYSLSLGFKINGEDFWIPQGIFVNKNPFKGTKGSAPYVKINGYDKWSLLDGTLAGFLEATYSIPIDSAPNSAASTLIALPGINDPKVLIADATDVLTPYTAKTDLGRTHADVLLELNGMLVRNIYFDTAGHLNSRDNILDTNKASIFDFNNGTNVVYLGGEVESDYVNAYNVIIIKGGSINGKTYGAAVVNENNASPLSVDNIGRKPKKPIFNSLIYSDESAEKLGLYRLEEASRLVSYVKFECLPIYHLDADQICTVTEESLDLLNERVVINSFTINFGNTNTMSVKATRTQELLFSFS